MKFHHLRKQTINEAYLGTLADDVWPQIFAQFGKLSGVLSEDRPMIAEFRRLAEEEEFDPFSHLSAIGKIDDKKDCVLSFSRGNEKLKQVDAVYLSLPAGYTCPFADVCKSVADRETGKMTGYGDIRCYAASAEARYPATRRRNWRNYDLLLQFKNDVDGMTNLILRSLQYYEDHNPPIRLFRIHESGDFFSQKYFDAWVKVAAARPGILFYAYTKSLPFWKKRKEDMPNNLRLIASEGGKMDELISKEQFRRVVIVKDHGEAIARRLNIDTNDFLAAFGDKDFALLLHGHQSKESGATSQAMKNSALLKASKKLRVAPAEIDRLFRYYTTPSQQVAAPAV